MNKNRCSECLNHQKLYKILISCIVVAIAPIMGCTEERIDNTGVPNALEIEILMTKEGELRYSHAKLADAIQTNDEINLVFKNHNGAVLHTLKGAGVSALQDALLEEINKAAANWPSDPSDLLSGLTDEQKKQIQTDLSIVKKGEKRK